MRRIKGYFFDFGIIDQTPDLDIYIYIYTDADDPTDVTMRNELSIFRCGYRDAMHRGKWRVEGKKGRA